MPEQTTTTPKKSRELKARANAIAEKCADAYSYDRYATWKGCAWLLVLRGYTDREVEAIMRSKWMRWAGDNSTARYGKIPARAIIEYIDDMTKRGSAERVAREVAELVAGTFSDLTDEEAAQYVTVSPPCELLSKRTKGGK